MKRTKKRYLPRTFGNSKLGTRGRVFLTPEMTLSDHQAWRLERKLNPGLDGGYGPVGEWPTEQECPEDPGKVYMFVVKNDGIFVRVKGKLGGAR